MKKSTRLLALLLMVILCVGIFTACGTKTKETTAATTTEAPATTAAPAYNRFAMSKLMLRVQHRQLEPLLTFGSLQHIKKMRKQNLMRKIE